MKRSRRPIVAFLLVTTVILYTVMFNALSVARYDAFHAATFDLGNLDQAM